MPSKKARDRAWAVFAVWGAMALLGGAMLLISIFLADSPQYPDHSGLALYFKASLALPIAALAAMIIGIWGALRERPFWIFAPAFIPVVTFLVAVHGYISYVNQPRSF